MLDTVTKRRIDTARDILVGKVPDPKSQVEQITIALIYKFMDDMDAQAEELGGKRKFFAGEFGKYGWEKLMAPGVSGHELIGLYGDGISKMPENSGIPPLFRDIFKNAYLPYRDPETLKAFLKIINEFDYDHSERLGDAFEYLLSVLGSQGDAGQFRTPRHIIDFMVAVVNPKKTETVLDPACGTAGFMISAYKHIMRANSTPAAIEKINGNGESEATLHTSKIPPAKGDLLTPDERRKLAGNFSGYDISPDMVRLSLVNMYLHGFTDPHIHEYDTLTSQDRWNEMADVILANPPFMSPKGGIKPHNRFSVQSKRSEVLFVDYMAEHLSPGGRAGIIVPEGIIFQSQTAYKSLRKMLVEQYLVAVVSLPAGVFQPYSGVKTSILILDKSLAKQSDTVGFFKVENDGFGLGAQRRPINKNDLPQVLSETTEYLRRVRAKESVSAEDFMPTRGLIVAKEKIAANGDYNLSGERYREGAVTVSAFPFVKVGDLFQKADESVMPETLSGPVTYIGLENITQKTGKLDGSIVTANPADIKSLKNVFKPQDVLYGKLRPNLNKVWFADRPGICSTDIFVIRPADDRVLAPLYAHIFRSGRFNDAVMSELKGAQLPRVGWSSFAAIEIPIPPLEVQKEIVAEIEAYHKVIDGARAVLDHYRPHIPINPEWPTPTFEEAPFEIIDGDRGANYPSKEDFSSSGYCLFLNTKNVRADGFRFDELEFITADKDAALRKGKLQRGDVILTTRGTVGNAGLYDESVKFEHVRINSGMLIFRPDTTQLVSSYLFQFFQSDNFRLQRDAIISGSAQPQLPIRSLNEARIPLPPLATQRAIVAEIEAEQKLVEANRELIERMEKKIAAAIARVWGEEGTSLEVPESGDEPDGQPDTGGGGEDSNDYNIEDLPDIAAEEKAPYTTPTPPTRTPDITNQQPDFLDTPPSHAPQEQDAEETEDVAPGPASIDSYGREDLIAVIREVFTERGVREGYDRESAIYAIAARLQFRRVGQRIRESVESALQAATLRQVIRSDSGIYRLETRNITDYVGTSGDKYVLVRKYLYAVMGHVWQDEEEAITSAARYLGFQRTGAIINETFRSAIRSALIRGELQRDGTRLRRMRS